MRVQIRKKASVFLLAFLATVMSYAGMTQEASEPLPALTLISNVNIFDGKSGKLQENMNVLIKDNKIETISSEPLAVPQTDNVTMIDGGGRTMTPGFIAVHEHIVGQMSFGELFNSDTRYKAYVAVDTVNTYLMNGFTAVRDVAGDTFSLKKAIDRGIIVGPRIYPSGPMISQTSGHADHRHDSQRSKLIGGVDDVMVEQGDMAVVDGVPEVLKAVREALRRGASQIKIAVGGGTGSYGDPLDVVEFTPEEIRAATQAASDWGTYVCAHVYNSDGIRRAIDNGVKSIEHANLVDEKTLRYMQKQDIWLSPQVSVYTYIPAGYTEDQANKHRAAYAGLDNLFKTAKKMGYDKIAFGTDIITDPEALSRMNEEFTYREKWFTPAEILTQATSKSAELLAMSGERNPYPGKLGVIEKGAYADLLLINGNPLKDLSILLKPDENLALIMKDGKIYKNTIQ
jgi:imidazolonepropionase-like amidohydrolase